MIGLKDGGVTSPKGYRAAGVACGLKNNGNKDLSLVVSDVTANAAGVYTRNVVKGHSLQLTMKRMEEPKVNAIVVNSGCANACVGEQGYADAVALTAKLGELTGFDPETILIGSTGVIGQSLPLPRMMEGLSQACRNLSYKGGHDAELAMMTTDTVPKEYAVECVIGGKTVRIGGMAKGSGMIHPNMGTMISIITTDAAVSAPLLQKALRRVADQTYNRVSVDGDTSVCDMCLLLANGMAGNEEIQTESNSDFEAFEQALLTVCEYLARMLAKDGEGATKLLEIVVRNADSKETAYTIATAVAKSPLCKTAFFGQDANWGRILTAAGYSGAQFDPLKVTIYLGDLMVCQNGCALPFDEELALEILKKNEVLVTIDLQSGSHSDRMWTCDFSYDYVKINGSYRS